LRRERQYRGDEASRLAFNPDRERRLMSKNSYRFHVGIDWAYRAHQVRVLNSEGKTVSDRKVDHTGSALLKFAEWLYELSEHNPASVAVGIETPRGAIVETLLERGFHVYYINPKQLDRFRDRHTVAGAKDDRRDAFVLADSLRTDLKLYRRVHGDHPVTVLLREASRLDQQLLEQQLQICNRLREQLHRYMPQVLELAPAADEPWLWTLLEAAPTPKQARRLTRARISNLLRAARVRRLSSQEVVAKLRCPAPPVAPGTVEAASYHVTVLLPQVQLLHKQRRQSERRLRSLLEEIGHEEMDDVETREHRDVDVLLSVPGLGTRTAATMLGEVPQPLADRDYHSLRARVGVAPVTRATGTRVGKRASVTMRRACNPRLRRAMHLLAQKAVQHDPHWASLHKRLRARHNQARSLRGIADRLLKVIVAMLRDNTLYDASRLRSGVPIES
jgi:transposase